MKRHCILIANGVFPNYPGLDTLTTPMGDIKNLVKVLNEGSDKETRDSFATKIVEDAKADDIFTAIKETIEDKDASPTDLFVIYYSGHGLLNRNLDLFLAANDIDGDANTGTPSRRVKFTDLIELVETHNLSRVLFILDCCHGAAAARGFEPRGDLAGELALGVQHVASDVLKFQSIAADALRKADSYNERHELKGDQGSGIYLMAACAAAQQAMGDKTIGMGVFTKHLCDGLVSEAIVPHKGKDRVMGFIPVSALFRYVSGKMVDVPQTPVLFARDVTSDDLIITNIYDLDKGNFGVSPSFTPWDRTSLFENISPTYILEGTESEENRYQFIDWNASFDSVVATPLRLVRGMHVQAFLEQLDNWESEVKIHSMKNFPPGQAPRVDVERLELKSERFGLVVFDKLASRLRDGSGRWCVTLNISYAQRPRALWEHLRRVMERDEMWSAYADSYDAIIGAFTANRELVQAVVNQVDGAEYCLDVGAGTGNTTVELLKLKGRRVHAIDVNIKMLQQLQKKLEDGPPDYRKRTSISHGDCLAILSRLKPADPERPDAPPAYEIPDETYDGCVMMNVLFALDRPVACLRQIRRVLKYDGVLSLSTSRTCTDVHNLFRQVRRELSSQEQWAAKEPLYQSAYDRNIEMIPIIVRHSQADIEGFLKRAGFELAQAPYVSYENCVLVYKAIKKKREAVREEDESD